MYNEQFNEVISRKGTHSIKWEFGKTFFNDDDILPMWVADMDFPSPPEVVKAVKERASHGIYGYTGISDEYLDSVVQWMKKRHQWSVAPEEITFINGVVPALNMLMQSFAQPGDYVVIQPPVYYPFFSVVRNNGQIPLLNTLVEGSDGYVMDFDDLEAKLKNPRTTIMILCSPHNPVGRVWKREELLRVAELCLAHDVLLISDEIHQDLVFDGFSHITTATLSEEIAHNTITCTAPSKTFNMAGLQSSNIMIQDEKKRRVFSQTLERNGVFGMNPFGDVATIAAYRHGEAWLDSLMQYLTGNLHYLQNFLQQRFPEIKMNPPEATYLAWLDCRSLNLSKSELEKWLVEKAGVALNQGYTFGDTGAGFVRLNFACPRSILEEGLERIEKAKNSL
ncbi:MAG: pyridoxal phosphate-dependent aminotransferase [Tindallia sp. MSAO_Bac2]|nr:MAG: pyridoxal phosphate-dependent aminotransferase [Tindallia sp. MSAO_Bac2]